MFSTVRYFIKTSVVFLLAGLISGLYLILSKYFGLSGYSGELITAHVHVILVGFVLMMIIGVALWFFPRPPKEDKKYNPDLIKIIYYLLTISTALRFIFEILSAFNSQYWFGIVIVISSFFQIISFVLFFYSIWGRIRPLGSAIREKKGEKF